MRVEFRKSFEKSLKKLPSQEREIVFEASQTLLNILEKRENESKGSGLRKLDKTFWEIRASIRLRIIFEWQADLIKFILIGSHDDIINSLKENI